MAVGKQVGDLPVANSAVATDALIIERNPGANNAVTYQIEVQDLFNGTGINKLATKSTPANNAVTSSQGTIWFDDNYVYVTTANNVTKRAALSTF
jgi:hypothetical protein